jgi:hypothetical protein
MDNEDIIDHVIRVEKASTGLRAAGEAISNNLIIAMLPKGLSESYKPFVVVHTQLDKSKTLLNLKHHMSIIQIPKLSGRHKLRLWSREIKHTTPTEATLTNNKIDSSNVWNVGNQPHYKSMS